MIAVMDRIDHMTNHPTGGLFIGIGTMAISWTSAIELGTTIFGFIGAFCGAVIGIRSVYVMIKDEIRKRKKKR